MKTNHIYQGDAYSVLKTFDNECVDLIITSPPYFNLRSYSSEEEIGAEKTVEEYVERLTTIFREAKRVLKKSGSFWLNISDVYGGSGAKRKKDYNKKYKQDGIDSFPVGLNKNINPKSLLGVPEQLMLSLINDGWILRNKCIWVKSIINKEGESVGGCMPTPCKDRFNQNAFEYFYFFTKNKKYYFDAEAIRVPYKLINKKVEQVGLLDTTPSKKLADIPSANTGFFNKEPYKQNNPHKTRLKNYDFSKGKIPVCAWQYNTIPVKGIHTALFPTHLLERPLKACLPKDGVVLDPFSGFATTWLAQKEYVPTANYVGIELCQEYIDESHKRLGQLKLYKGRNN